MNLAGIHIPTVIVAVIAAIVALYVIRKVVG